MESISKSVILHHPIIDTRQGNDMQNEEVPKHLHSGVKDMSREQISNDSCSISTSCHVFRLFGDVCNSAATRPDADVIDDGRGEGCSGRPHAN